MWGLGEGRIQMFGMPSKPGISVAVKELTHLDQDTIVQQEASDP